MFSKRNASEVTLLKPMLTRVSDMLPSVFSSITTNLFDDTNLKPY